MNIRYFSILSLGLLFTLNLAQAESEGDAEGPRTGGGGGAYVCRNAGKEIESVELLDLFETRELDGQAIAYDDQTPPEQQVDQALERLREIHPDFAAQTGRAWNQIKGHITWGSDKLDIKPPNDARSHFSKKDCELEGMMYYNGANQRLIVKSATFKAQKRNTEVAASYMHEAIYKALRDKFDAHNSLLARHLNGCLFAENAGDCLGLVSVKKVPAGFKHVWDCKNHDGLSFLLLPRPQWETYDYLSIGELQADDESASGPEVGNSFIVALKSTKSVKFKYLELIENSDVNTYTNTPRCGNYYCQAMITGMYSPTEFLPLSTLSLGISSFTVAGDEADIYLYADDLEGHNLSVTESADRGRGRGDPVSCKKIR